MSSSDVKSSGVSLRQIEDPATRRLLEGILNNINVLKDTVGVLEYPEATAWFDVVLQNNWVRFDNAHNPPQYSISSDGIIRLRGMIRSGTATTNTVLFTLPSGIRPEFISVSMVLSNAVIGRVDVEPSGNVVIIAGSNVYLTLDDISFQAYS